MVTSEIMKVANSIKLKVPNKHLTIPKPAPPDREAEERENNKTTVDGKGSISFLLPNTHETTHNHIETANQPNEQHNNKIQRKRANRKSNKQNLRQAKKQEEKLISDYCAEVTETKNSIRNEKEALTVFQEMKNTDAQIEHELHLIDAINNATNESVARALENDDDEVNTSWPSAIYDTGATSSCGKIGDPFLETGKQSTKVFKMPNGHKSPASDLKLLEHELREPARDVHMVPELQGTLLVSAGKLADANYVSIFDKDEVNVYDMTNTKITVSRGAILKGWRDSDGLWRIPLRKDTGNKNEDYVVVKKPPTEFLPSRPPPTEAIYNVYELKTQPELIRYYHAAAGFPTKPTWLKAIKKGFYSSWVGLTDSAVQRHFPESEETWKGHAKKIKSGLRSTKKKGVKEDTPKMTSDDIPRPITTNKEIFVQTYDIQNEFQRTIYTDQTGKFPDRSSKGNQYIMTMVEMDSQAILVEAMKNRSSDEMIRAYQVLIDRLKERGVVPKHHVLDNECSEEFKRTIKENKMTYQLVDAHDHRRNIAEKAIQTFKNHFVSVLCGTDENFPMRWWDRLLKQAEHQLNMLRPSRLVPTVSAYTYLYGTHDYNAHPFAPLGCKVEMYEMPSTRKSWGTHTITGWYLGTSWEHYRNHKIVCKDTRAERISPTVFFKHKYLTMPTMTPADALLKAGTDLTTALQGVLPKESVTQEAIQQLMKIYKLEAKKQHTHADSQRVRKESALEQRVHKEVESEKTEEAVTPKPSASTQGLPQFIETEEENKDNLANSPAMSTRTKTAARTITQDILMHVAETTTRGNEISAKSAASRKYPLQFLCDYANAVLDDETGEMMEYRHLIKNPKYREAWGRSFGNEIGRLAQGMPGRVTGTETIFFIHKTEVPTNRWKDITYGRICCNYREQKAEKNRTRLTVGGNLINYPGDCGTPTADMLTVKLLFNSVISTPYAQFMTIDIKNFYLNTPMPRFEYMKMKLSDYPEDVILQYGLREKVSSDGYIYIEVRKGMYGLPQAGLLAQQLLEERLNKHGYFQSKFTPGLWTHKWRPICFSLVVDDFGVKYVGKEHAEHLVSAIKNDYEATVEWEGTKYLGLTIDWDYDKREAHVSIPNYVKEACIRFKHETPKRTQDQPHQHAVPVYGATIQYVKKPDKTRELDKEEKRYIQQVVGTFPYYGRAVDATMLPALSAIASTQAKPTEETMKKTKQFLDYAVSHPDAIITYNASKMVLAKYSDASYLSKPEARSRAGGHFSCQKIVKTHPTMGQYSTLPKSSKQSCHQRQRLN